MEVRLLGAVEASAKGIPINLRWPKNRLLLAILALEAGRAVPTDVLIDRLWDAVPPPNARRTLYTYVARLRQLIVTVTGEQMIHRTGGGYRLDVAPDDVDALSFRGLCRQGFTTTDDPARADLLGRALALHRGTPLAGLNGDWAARVREALIEQRIDALARWAGAQLVLGRAGAVIDELTPALAEHQLAERLAAELIRALHAAGRNADALRLYGTFRRRLINHLGTEPGAELKDVHATLLRAPVTSKAPVLPPSSLRSGPSSKAVAAAPESAPAMTATTAIPPAAPSVEPGKRRAPAQLPPGVWGFVGRGDERAELDRLLADVDLDPDPQSASAPVVATLSGTAGVGKTALAVHWAHSVRSQFPDGQLYVDMHGYDPLQPRTSAEALAGFLRALGLGDQEIPPDVEERAAVFRTMIFGSRMLILIDNVAEAEQVRLLLPGTPSCFVLMTSRDALAGLVALHGVRRIDVDLLPPAAATDLLAQLIGNRVRAEPEAAAVLAEQCARLPLTLRVVAEQSVAHPTMSLNSLVDDLKDEHGRLTLLGASTPGSLVRTVFSWSYRRLPPEAARTFRMLSQHPGPDIDAAAAAALLDRPEETTRGLLDGLTSANLARSAQSGRYAMHDLLRVYAAELSHTEEGSDARRAALTRLLDHFLSRAATAVAALYPGGAEVPEVPGDPRDQDDPEPENLRALGPAEPGAQRLGETDTDTETTTVNPATAAHRAWLDAERANLMAVSRYSMLNGWPSHTIRLADVLARHLHTVRYYTDAIAIYAHACEAARALGDDSALARALNVLGVVSQGQGHFDQAIRHYLLSLAHGRLAGDRLTQAKAVSNLGSVLLSQGQPELAGQYLRWTLRLSREIDCLQGEAAALCHLGQLHLVQGNAIEVGQHFHQALVLYRQVGDRVGEASTLAALGAAHTHWGNLDVAAGFHRRALQVSREVRDPDGAAYALLGMGLVAHLEGETEKAVERHREALRLHRAIGNLHGETHALNGTGEALRASGRLGQSLTNHAAALALAAELGDVIEQSRAHAGLAHAYEAAGDLAQAGRHRDHARDLDDALLPGSPRAGEVPRSFRIPGSVGSYRKAGRRHSGLLT